MFKVKLTGSWLFATALAVAVAGVPDTGRAQSIDQALAQAYSDNPTLNAAPIR